jgi:hypothetical protein
MSASAGSGVAGFGSGVQMGVSVCMWVPWCRGVCVSVSTRRVLGEKPQRLGRDTNATSRPRRGGGRARRGQGIGMERLGQGKARAGQKGGSTACVRGKGAHARTRVLASQGRGVAVPCAGHRHHGPAARCGGERRRRLRGMRRRDGLLHKNGAKAGKGRGPRDGYTEGSSAWSAAVGKSRGYGGNSAHRWG